MSDKPSLYVVEKKEVIILVVLFILVTILAFTMGVRYGESLGKKTAVLEMAEEKAHSPGEADKIGGTLVGEAPKEGAPSGEHGVAEPVKPGEQEKKEIHGEEVHTGPHGEAAKAAGHGEEHSPESAAKPEEKTEAKKPPLATHGAMDAVEKESDEYLLNALKDAGVESPGGAAPKNATLPETVKKIKAGSWLIQVGSHPTLKEAEGQLKLLQSKKVNAQILPPYKDAHGEWNRVVIGEFKNKHDADREAAHLKSKGAFISYFVWRLP